ncbi:metal ABC transporter ATP-binding protein [Paractinoplanes brasiliensis]|uniref:Manganese/iron transport system ATP-binding protein n=1 Tax=Paractinoplanes brasiliensis TaxID=52695 RepID=A0A4R6JZR3_9ACTN|nr:metal ABC transporter ATP-binding protein [Actinoplanes brasiliensis]TDO41927.1 manganese/iron transport system ATP-binding protein [Actinoplanes brasiliensis]GID29791.1 manganese ABC transporter ATP-binding protein [Actinoplanes brasiliensis]
MAPVLRYAGVSVGYDSAPVLTHVDLELAAGQRLALVGPNGAGKSTLIKSVLGLVPVLAGSATVLGADPAAARGRAGYVPQTDTLDADFPVSVRQVVMMGRYRAIGWWRPAGTADRRAVAEALDRVGLADRAGHRFGTLSGGQRQRVLLARAIAAEPRLLLLDEPFNGVDVVSQEAITRVLRELSDGGTALVLSTHDLGVARDLADQVSLLNGRQWAVGKPADTLTADKLRAAYGGHAVDLPDGRMILVEP